jgi:hypothetical protein
MEPMNANGGWIFQDLCHIRLRSRMSWHVQGLPPIRCGPARFVRGYHVPPIKRNLPAITEDTSEEDLFHAGLPK